jgi:transposase
MPLNTRSFVCGSCGNVEDRDLNAAYNRRGASLRSGNTSKTPFGPSVANYRRIPAALAVGVLQTTGDHPIIRGR